MRRLSCLRIIVKNHIVLIALGFPRLRHGLHQALLRDEHQLSIDRLARVHAQEPSVVLDLLILRLVLARALLIRLLINDSHFLQHLLAGGAIVNKPT